MAFLDDGREVPDHYNDITPTDTTRTKPKMSARTRALGIALGAAETIVPAGQGPLQIASTNLRALAKAAKDYILHGAVEAARPAFEAGKATGAAALAGDPKAQGAALAALTGTALGAKSLYGRAAPAVGAAALDPLARTPALEASAAAPGVIEEQAARAAAKFKENVSPTANATYENMLQRRRQRAVPPDYTGPERRAAEIRAELEARRQRYREHTAESILPDVTASTRAELEAEGFMGMGPESMTPADVLKTRIFKKGKS